VRRYFSATPAVGNVIAFFIIVVLSLIILAGALFFSTSSSKFVSRKRVDGLLL